MDPSNLLRTFDNNAKAQIMNQYMAWCTSKDIPEDQKMSPREPLMEMNAFMGNDPEVVRDANGMCFCSEHLREVCYECLVDLRGVNSRHVAVQGGAEDDHDLVVKTRTPLEEQFVAFKIWCAKEKGVKIVPFGDEEANELLDEWSGGKWKPWPAMDLSNCNQCGKQGDLNRCTRCSRAFYCGRECQKAAWRSHRPYCVATAIPVEPLEVDERFAMRHSDSCNHSHGHGHSHSHGHGHNHGHAHGHDEDGDHEEDGHGHSHGHGGACHGHGHSHGH